MIIILLFFESAWISWGLFFDPGTQTGIPANDKASVKFVAMLFSILGFIYNLSLLGLIVDFIRSTLQRWRLRHGRIVQNNHTLILGLSERTVLLLHELLQAYAGKDDTVAGPYGRGSCCSCCSCCKRRCRKRRAVVILADRNELEIEQVVTSHLNEYKISSQDIYFREGDPTDWRELQKVSTGSADDIIVVGSGSGTPQASDQEVLRTILALAALPEDDRVSGEVFAEMRISENIHVVNTVLPTAQGIVARVAVNRMFCLMAIDPDVGRCIEDLVSFRSGAQLFNIPCPVEFEGRLFEEALIGFPYAVVIGVKEKERKIDSKIDTTQQYTYEEWYRIIRDHSHLNHLSDDDLKARWKRNEGLENAYQPGILHPFGQHLKSGDRLIALATTAYDAVKGARHSNGRIGKSRKPSFMKRVRRASSQDKSAEPGRSLTQGFTLHPSCDASLMERLAPKQQTICMIGCPADYIDLLQILNLSVAPGSKVHILSESSLQWRMERKKKDFGGLSTDATPNPEAAELASDGDKKEDSDAKKEASDDKKEKFDARALGSPRDARRRSAQEAPSWQMGKIRVYDHEGPTTSRRHLSQLPLQSATSVIIMSEHIQDDDEPSAADSRNLNSVITLARMLKEMNSDVGEREGCGTPHRRIICELQDNRSEVVVDRNMRLRRLCDHYFHSNMLETAMFAMAAEDRAVFNSLLELLTPGRGCQVISIPIDNVISKREELSFWQLHSKVLQRYCGILVGYYRNRQPGDSRNQDPDAYGPTLNPPDKDARLDWDPKRRDTLLAVVRPPQDDADNVQWNNQPPVSPDDHEIVLPGAVSTPSPGP